MVAMREGRYCRVHASASGSPISSLRAQVLIKLIKRHFVKTCVPTPAASTGAGFLLVVVEQFYHLTLKAKIK